MQKHSNRITEQDGEVLRRLYDIKANLIEAQAALNQYANQEAPKSVVQRMTNRWRLPNTVNLEGPAKSKIRGIR